MDPRELLGKGDLEHPRLRHERAPGAPTVAGPRDGLRGGGVQRAGAQRTILMLNLIFR